MTAGTTDSTSGQPSRSLEIERKYDVDDATPLPDWTTLAQVTAVGDAEVRDLDARYFDTGDLRLAAAGVALRRRTGGPDEGWHVKVAAAEGRDEYHWNVGEESAPIPDAVARAVAHWAAPPFEPLARICNTRTAYALSDPAGAVIAEFVDDTVTATAERTGAVSRWREWEVELAPGALTTTSDREAFFAEVDVLVAGVGGRPAASDSKLRRAIGA